MKKFGKRVLSLLLTGAMTAALLSGCGIKKVTVLTDDDIINNKEPIKLTVFSQTTGLGPRRAGAPCC